MGAHSNYSNNLYNDYERLQKRVEKFTLENKHISLEFKIAKDNERRALLAESRKTEQV